VTTDANGVYGFQFGASGAGNPPSISTVLAASVEQWLELTVDGVAQAPRQKILAVPFALMAGGLPDGAISSSMIADGAVNLGNLSPGVAASINAGLALPSAEDIRAALAYTPANKADLGTAATADVDNATINATIATNPAASRNAMRAAQQYGTYGGTYADFAYHSETISVAHGAESNGFACHAFPSLIKFSDGFLLSYMTSASHADRRGSVVIKKARMGKRGQRPTVFGTGCAHCKTVKHLILIACLLATLIELALSCEVVVSWHVSSDTVPAAEQGVGGRVWHRATLLTSSNSTFATVTLDNTSTTITTTAISAAGESPPMTVAHYLLPGTPH
jgi:hypothetical protein